MRRIDAKRRAQHCTIKSRGIERWRKLFFTDSGRLLLDVFFPLSCSRRVRRRKPLAVAANKSFNLLNWVNLGTRMPNINLSNVSSEAFCAVFSACRLFSEHCLRTVSWSDPRIFKINDRKAGGYSLYQFMTGLMNGILECSLDDYKRIKILRCFNCEPKPLFIWSILISVKRQRITPKDGSSAQNRCAFGALVLEWISSSNPHFSVKVSRIPSSPRAFEKISSMQRFSKKLAVDRWLRPLIAFPLMFWIWLFPVINRFADLFEDLWDAKKVLN